MTATRRREDLYTKSFIPSWLSTVGAEIQVPSVEDLEPSKVASVKR